MVCASQRSWETEKDDTPQPEEAKMQEGWWKQKGCFQGRSILVGYKEENLIAPQRTGAREEVTPRSGREVNWEREAGGGGVSVVGRWELQLVLNVFQQSPSRDNNIGCFINLITVPCQTPVSAFTPLLIFPFPLILHPHHFSASLPEQRAAGKTKSPRLWTNSAYQQWPTHNQGNGD